jgi:hypothetical protein
MPSTLQAFIWVFGLGVIGLLLTVVGFLIKDKLDSIMKVMVEFRADVIELFKEDKRKLEIISEIKGHNLAKAELCEERHKQISLKFAEQEAELAHLRKIRISDNQGE